MFSILIAFITFSFLYCPAQTEEKCDNSLCNHEAICRLKDAIPVCNCVRNFFKGDSCSEMIDHCNPNSCRNKGTCRPYIGHYSCQCPEGFSGQKCTSKKDTFTGLHLHYNHIAQLGEEQVFLLIAQTLGTVQTLMDVYTADYVIDGASFSSETNHFMADKQLKDLAKRLNLKHSETMPYESGFYRISRGTFWTLGVQQITLALSDEEDSESFFRENFEVLVYDPSEQMCLPVIRLPNCENPRQSLHLDMVSFNFIEPVLRQRCGKRSDFRVKWSVRNYIDSVVLHSFAEESSSNLVIPPYTMWFDFRDDYVQSYLIQGDVREVDAEGSVIGRTVLRCYVFVDSKNTQAKITGGQNREVNVDTGFVIDGSLSRDFARRPNGDQLLNYKWSCASEDEVNDFCSNDMGSEPKLFVPPKALNLEFTYKYRLEVQSTINIYSTSSAYQSITPLPDDPLLLDFKCFRNCEQLRFAAGKPIHLKVRCIDCPPGAITYSIRDGSGAEVSTSNRVIMTEDVKSEISFRATAILGARSGAVSVKLKLNKPPTSGKCVVSPPSGIAFQTIFQISCPGYKDLQPIRFTYRVGNSTLDYSRNKTLTTRLYPTKGGTSEVTVDICDDLGACTRDRLQVSLGPLSPSTFLLEFLQQPGSDLQKIIVDGDRPSANALIKAVTPYIPPEDALKVTEYIVRSLERLEVSRLLAIEQVLRTASQLFDSVPVNSQSVVLISKLFSQVSRGLQHSIRNQEIAELDFQTQEQMLNDIAKVMAGASAEVEEFPRIHSAEVMPPNDRFAEDYPDYEELDVQEVVNISNWLRGFNEIHKCLQLMGVASAFLQLPGETPLLVGKKDLTSKTLVVDTSERASLTLGALKTVAQIPSGFLKSAQEQEVAVQFSVFDANPFWWCPEQYKVRTEVMSLGIYWKDLSKSPSPQKRISFTMALKESKGPEDTYLVKGQVKGSLDMPVYAKTLPPNAVLVVKFLPPTGAVRVLLTIGKKPRSYMLAQASKVSTAATFVLVNPNSTPNKAFIAVAARNQISFTFSLSVRLCLTWNPISFDWTSEDCSVGSETNATHIHCSCSHLSMFAAKVHPTFVLLQPSESLNAELTLNYSLMATHFLIVSILLGCLFLAWRRDLTAANEVVALNIKPNQPTPHKYFVTIFTSGHAFAATSSNITIQLQGTLLNSPEFALYGRSERNAQQSFHLSCPRYLGTLQSVSLRHDSFGWSPSWNCHAVSVLDKTSGEQYLCIVDKWLSHYESTSCSAMAKPLTKADLNRKMFIFCETMSSEFANWYAQQVCFSPRLHGNLSGTEKTAIFVVRVCVVLVGVMIVFGPTTMFTYEEERETYYYMLLDFGTLMPIVFLCHLLGLAAAVALRYLFVELRSGMIRNC